MPEGLSTYRAKRRFAETPEPDGTWDGPEESVFVIQKHHARRMHYDLRLQIGDRLRSWAVPEGPCLDPKIRRFAKLVEDHPLDYAAFEGRIPAGNYGAGTVIVWDHGTWVTLGDPEGAMEKGEIKFRLNGEKLSGGWTLVQLKDDPTNWLLIKERDPSARPLGEYDVLIEKPNSVITGRPVDEPTRERKPSRPRQAARIPGALEAPMPLNWRPQLAEAASTPPPGTGWLHEIKYDGYRTIALIDQGAVRLLTRNGHDWTARYAGVAAALAKLSCRSAVIDGEMVVQDPRGVTSISLLEQALSAGETLSLTYFAFDLCHLNGYDLSAAPLRDRRGALEGLLAPMIDDRSALQFSDHVEGDGEALFAHASRMGLEGVVSKRADAPYVHGRAPSWVKVKRVDVADFVVIGFLTSGQKTTSSLILAEERDGELVYAGRAGSGIGEDRGRAVFADLAPLKAGGPIIPTPRTPGAHWIEPRWTAEIGYRGRTPGGALRSAVFMSMAPRRRVQPARALKARLIVDRDLAAVSLTNPERNIGADGVTKLDVALYYARIGDWLLPELLGRPVTTIRCPTGDLRALFYQRHAFAGLPDGVETVELSGEEGRAAFITVTEPKGYLGLAQFGALEFHPWGCRIEDPEHPDRLVVDLDPDEGLAWARVCDAAEVLRERLEAMGASPFLRTTGGKGLHLVLALAPGQSWPLVKGFAEAFAKAAARDAPAMFTATSSKDRRKGRVYIDYLRNARGASAVASYSLRARSTFPVATPIFWHELRKLPGSDAFDRLSVLKRVERLASDPWDGLGSSKVGITPKMRRDVGLKE